MFTNLWLFSNLIFPSENDWAGFGPWAESIQEAILVASLLISLAIRACEFLVRVTDEPTGFTTYFKRLNELDDNVLVSKTLVELVLANDSLFALFTLAVMEAAIQSDKDIWAELEKEKLSVIARYDAIYRSSELAYVISFFDCMSDGRMRGYIISLFRTGKKSHDVADFLRQLCYGLCTEVKEEELSREAPACRFLATIYKVVSFVLSVFFFNLFIYLLLPVDDPEFIRTGSRIPG